MRYEEIINEAGYKPHRFNGSLPDFKQTLTAYWGELSPETKKVGKKEFIYTTSGQEAGYFVTTSEENGVAFGGGRIVRKDKKSAKAPAPAPAPAPKPAPVVTKQSENAIDALKTIRASMYSADSRAHYRDITGDEKRATFEVRHWGSWQVPDGEEDDGDYDWEELTDASRLQLRAIVDKVKSQYPGVTIHTSVSEKNWIDFQAIAK